MNKSLIVVLAICLVSVHAFVKRDAPAANTPSTIEELTKNMEKLANDMKEKLEKAFDPDTVKKNMNDFVDNVTAQINKLKPASEAPKQ